MAGAFIDVNIDDKDVQYLLNDLSKRFSNLTPVMKEIGDIVTESVQRNFEEHRSPEGISWEPLAESTKEQKEKKGRNADDILVLHRILMGSIHPEAYADHVDVGTDIVYAAIHQFGGETGRGHKVKIPARSFLGVRDEDWAEIEDMIVNELFGDL